MYKVVETKVFRSELPAYLNYYYWFSLNHSVSEYALLSVNLEIVQRYKTYRSNFSILVCAINTQSTDSVLCE